MTTKSTKRALIVSVLSLFICFTMLLGTTYAWFTDSVTSAGNIIKTGTLDVTLKYSAELPVAVDGKIEDATQWADASTGAIFYHDNWEPGYTQVRYVKVENEGSLDLKFVLTIVPNQEVADGEADLADVIDVYIAKEVVAVDRALTGLTRVGTLADLIADPDGAAYGVLYADDADKAGKTFEAYTIVLKMQETAGNEYQDKSVGGGFTVQLLATQLASEADDLGADYDTEATLPVVAAGTKPLVRDDSGVLTEGAYEVIARIGNTTSSGTAVNAGSAVVPAAAIADSAEELALFISEAPVNSNIIVNDGDTAKTYEISMDGIKSGNTTPIKVELYVGDVNNVVQLYHNETPIDCTYNPINGYIYFETTGFSPFTLVTNDNVFVPENGPLPVAKVTEAPEFVNVSIDWKGYGGINPDFEVDADPKLEAAFVFETTETADQAALSPYANWTCDFFVSLDRDLEANQILLAGNYGTFGWVGFHNGDQALDANTEVGLLTYAQGGENSWTYAMIADLVGGFSCGVGDVNNALSGATFTVKLRLTNPENANEYYDIETVTYTFQ